jgi:hypothetical protein
VSRTGYLALSVNELPDVRFDMVVRVRLTGRTTRVTIDHRYMAVIEKDTIEVCGYSCIGDHPRVCSFGIKGDQLTVKSGWILRPSHVVVRLSAIRRDFRGVFFPEMTEQDYHENEEWLRRGLA